MHINRQITLISHVYGIPTEDNFKLIGSTIPEPQQGDILICNYYFSLEPAIRSWLDGKETYFPPIPLGGVVRCPSVGWVVKSLNYGERGYVTAYENKSGNQLWRFYKIPGDSSKPFENPVFERASVTWTGTWWKDGGGGTV